MASISRKHGVKNAVAELRRRSSVSVDPFAKALGDASKSDLHEALDNFRAYLAILREWDKRQRSNDTSTVDV